MKYLIILLFCFNLPAEKAINMRLEKNIRKAKKAPYAFLPDNHILFMNAVKLKILRGGNQIIINGLAPYVDAIKKDLQKNNHLSKSIKMKFKILKDGEDAFSFDQDVSENHPVKITAKSGWSIKIKPFENHWLVIGNGGEWDKEVSKKKKWLKITNDIILRFE